MSLINLRDALRYEEQSLVEELGQRSGTELDMSFMKTQTSGSGTVSSDSWYQNIKLTT